MKKAIIYLNQFFGQIGGEDKADIEPFIHEGQIGPAMQYAKAVNAEVTHTIVCGDNYMGSNTEKAVEAILSMLEDKEFDIFFAGPAFQAGRYGVACGTICKAVKEKFGVPVITSMNEENPGVEMFKKDMYNTMHVYNYMKSSPAYVYPDEKMDSVMKKFETTDAWNLPVVDHYRTYLGFVSKSKIFSAYRNQLKEVSHD